ncbi:MAG: class I SAM-dependent methyltransferase [Nitrospirales bacterium]|nr:class I SAM-dependent methyltransferase [Nitrospira sp.]MDR4502193.1 class I SAM-dependent methyltransferase [Nitrospirales bacterium]
MKIREIHPSYLWRFGVQRIFHRTYPETPLLTSSAVILLDNWLKPTDLGLEYGSGRSTIWIARRIAKLTTVEHEAVWFNRVQQKIAHSGLSGKIDYRLIPTNGGQMDEPYDHPYALVADEMEDTSLDFVLIDGQMRLRCLERALPKLKSGGLLVLDGANRYVPNSFESKHTTIQLFRDEPLDGEWREILSLLRPWRWINTTDGLWDTRLWVKP